jgi:tetratricopeptide (TPR) repeat protein
VAEHYLGIADVLDGEYERAIEHVRRAVERLPDESCRESFGQFLRPAAFARYVLARALAEVGRFGEALLAANEAVRVAELTEHPPTLARALSDVGFVHLELGDLGQAIRVLERAVALGSEIDFPSFYNQILENMGLAYARAGRGAEARAVLAPLTDAPERLTRAGRSAWIALAEVHLDDGDIAGAREVAERARTHLVLSGKRDEIAILRLLGDIAAREEVPDAVAAEEALRAALDGAEASGLRPLAARCRLSRGQLYARIGRADEARDELAASADAFRAMGMVSDLATAERDLGALVRVPT